MLSFETPFKKWMGFYNTKKLDSITTLTKFFKRALELSYSYRIDIKDDSYSRISCKTKTLEEILNIISPENHNVCIDRTIQHTGTYDIDEGEVGFCTLNKKYDIFLFIFMTKENVIQLAKEFELEYL